MRSRIRTTMTGEGLYQRPFHIHEKSRTRGERRIDALMRSTQRKIADALQPRRRILPWLALNEVFMAEFYASRPIALTVQIDDSEINSTHSSGICVCTGSGSRSWFKTMNMQSSETIQMLAAMATGKQLDKTKSEKMLFKYHNNLHFPPEDLKMAYMIYEWFHGARCSAKSFRERQMCSKVKIKSGGFDAGLVLDGCVSLPFNDGSTATFEIQPEFALKNIILMT
ncbi:NAD kinase 2, mitochondrial-like [Cataglyphis hispanica]|uniref:NAD kinase 2, mitochondrial-like n=1 Tax=Cataglyphis hispanica TaxID=1086592 RepID=UPI00217FB0BF|nr:NAD kinase 2, mitochondrial-like [Cataglyphis hispanica]